LPAYTILLSKIRFIKIYNQKLQIDSIVLYILQTFEIYKSNTFMQNTITRKYVAFNTTKKS